MKDYTILLIIVGVILCGLILVGSFGCESQVQAMARQDRESHMNYKITSCDSTSYLAENYSIDGKILTTSRAWRVQPIDWGFYVRYENVITLTLDCWTVESFDVHNQAPFNEIAIN